MLTYSNFNVIINSVMIMETKIVASTSERLVEAMKRKNMRQADLVRLTGIDKSSISLYISGKYSPKGDKLYKLSVALGVTAAWLSGFNAPMLESAPSDYKEDARTRKAVKIPVLGYVRAGIPMEAVENIIDYEEIREEMARTGEFFALQIKGDSMEPKISEGDVVIVRKQETVENGDIAVVLVNGDEATVKKFYKADNGISLISTNTKYDPFYYSPEAVNSLPVIVIGKVVELRAKF